jgi:hypothetical protein
VRGRPGGRLVGFGDDRDDDVDPGLDVAALQPPHVLLVGPGQARERPLLDGDQGRLGEGELDMPADQGAQRGVRPARLPDALAALGEQPLADPDEHVPQHGLLAGEVPVDRRA